MPEWVTLSPAHPIVNSQSRVHDLENLQPKLQLKISN